MKISVIIPYYENRIEKRELLKRAIKSLNGDYEVIVIWNEGKGFSKSVNLGYQLATGDFLIMASDDVFLESGKLEDLCIDGVVTSPVVNGKVQDFWGCMWCLPRRLYNRIGGLDEGYSEGIYYEDTDMWETLKSNSIPHYCVETVKIQHPEGGATLTKDPKYLERQEINRQYFIKKWGKEC